MTADVKTFLSAPAWEAILAAARARIAALGRVGGTAELSPLSSDQADVLRGLSPTPGRGAPRPGRAYTLDLRRLDAALQATRYGIGLAAALELTGPLLESAPERRERERHRREAFWARARDHALCARDPRAAEWIEGLRARGALVRIAGRDGESLLLVALDLGERLPARPAVERSRLAAEVAGDPHALDDDRPLARLLIRQLAARAGDDVPRSALERRDLLARFGIACDALSCDVLTLGLRPLPDGRLARALGALDGRHMRITLAQLEGERLRFPPGLRAFCCENPVVLAAAEQRLWPDVPVLVCTAGWPSAAACALLASLRRNGAALVYHGDLDWEGLRIFGWLRERFGVAPWRFDAASYRAGLAGRGGRAHELSGTPPADLTPWPDLAAAMHAEGRALPEELVLTELLDDLAQAAPGT
ncbi:MAG: TIGR02679 family protein [Thermoleophilaceae bacterium]